MSPNAPPFWCFKYLRFDSIGIARLARISKVREYDENKFLLAGWILRVGFCRTFSAALEIALIKASDDDARIARTILFSGPCDKNFTVCFTFFSSLRTFFDFD